MEFTKKAEKPGEKLARFMEDISHKLNKEIFEYGEEKPLLDKNNSINMEAFGYSDVEVDKQKVFNKDIEWSGATDPEIMEFYGGKYGTVSTSDVVREFRKNKENNPSAQLEKAITGLLHKVLGSEFMVMRSSDYDDYFYGIDNVIVNRETGDVICAFDEVHDEKDGKRQLKKIKKIKDVAGRGGATLKYGITFEKDEVTGKNKLVKKSIKNIPVFYLGLSSKELSGLVSRMDFSSGSEANSFELEIFGNLVESLKGQIGILEKYEIEEGKIIHHEVKKKLDKFKILLSELIESRLKKAA